MDRIKAICKDTNWDGLGVAAFYGYFAVNMLMKAFAYDHGDDIYKYFFIFGILFLVLKLAATKYTLRELIWAGIMVGIGLVLSIITKTNTWLLLFVTIVGMKGCRFQSLIKIALYVRAFTLSVLVIGSTFGVFDIGYKTKPDASYVEIPIFNFAMGDANTAFLSVFLTVILLMYVNYEKLNKKWFFWTSAVIIFFYELTFCRTGIIVFFFCWMLIYFEKNVKSDKIKSVLAMSIPVGTLFSMATMIIYNPDNSIMATLNRYVSSRIYITNAYYLDQGIALFPRSQEFFYASYHGLIDNSYMFVLIYGGVFVALFFFALLSLMLYRLYKQRCYKELVMIGAMALYGVLEQFVMNGFMNPFILLGAILLYPNILEEKEESYEALSDSASA